MSLPVRPSSHVPVGRRPRLRRRRSNRLSTLIAGAALGLASPPVVSAGLGDPPAFPVPECRDANNGDEVACNDVDAVRLWPGRLRPGLPGESLPVERNSTGWVSLTIPGAASGHELFHSLDILGDHLFVAYNAGLQVWDISGEMAEDPQFLAGADGWLDDFLDFPIPGEIDTYTNDVAAIAPSTRGHDVLVAVSADSPVGVSIWHFTPPSTLTPIYQDQGNDSRQVRTAELGGVAYAFAAGPGGVSVYDLTAAAALASPCLDTSGSVCPGVYLGEVGTMARGGYVDVIERAGSLYLAASDGSLSGGLGLEIWELSDPATPGTAVLKFSGLATDTRGLALFEHQGGFYLAAIERDGDRKIRFFDADPCLDADGCVSPGAPLAEIAPRPTGGAAHYLTFSTSGATPFLYYGVSTSFLDGSKAELLLDLTDLGAGNQIVEITEGGGTYFDAGSGSTVDYWGDYYAGNTHGLNNFQPRVGRFQGKFFYRAAFGILDVHVETGIFSDGFESGDAGAWSSQVP